MRKVSVVAAFTLPLLLSSAAYSQWVTFQDQTATHLVAAANVGSANVDEKDYAWGDLDHDGDIDLVAVYKQPGTTTGRRRNALFMNENGVLVDRTNEFASAATVTLQGGAPSQGFLDLTNDRDVVVVDVNGDGWLDVVTATTLSGSAGKAISHPRVYINRKDNPPGSGTWQGLIFDDMDRVPTMPSEPRFCSVSAGDIDGDGDQDLYFGDYQQGGSRPVDLNDRLWINDGTGYFADQSSSRMTAEMLESSFAMSTAIADMNGDGRLDIVKDDALNAPQGISISYNNKNNIPGMNGFFDAYEVVYTLTPYHVAVGDLNNDNRLDMAVSDDANDRYILNTGNGADNQANFSSTFLLQGSNPADFGSNNLIVDLNNDGFNDVLVANVDVDEPNCVDPSKIFRNLGNLPNVTLTQQGNCGIAQSDLNGVHDWGVFDLNGDGWKDIVVGTCAGTKVYINQPPVGMVFSYPQGLPSLIPPGQPYPVQVQLTVFGGAIQPGTAQLHYSINGAPYAIIVMSEVSTNLYEVDLPILACTETINYYFSIQSTTSTTFKDPSNAPTTTFSATGASSTDVIFLDNFETSGGAGWIVQNGTIAGGKWNVVNPNGTISGTGLQAAPEDDAEALSQFTKCFVTENGAVGGSASSADVDGGPTDLISPVLDLTGTDATISYARWFFCDDYPNVPAEADQLVVAISNTGTDPWITVETVNTTSSTWLSHSFKVSDFVTPTSTVRVRFRANDTPNNSTTEAGVDIFRVEAFVCNSVDCNCRADVDGSGQRDGNDIAGFIDCYLGAGANCGCADMNGSSSLDATDVDEFVTSIMATLPCQ